MKYYFEEQLIIADISNKNLGFTFFKTLTSKIAAILKRLFSSDPKVFKQDRKHSLDHCHQSILITMLPLMTKSYRYVECHNPNVLYPPVQQNLALHRTELHEPVQTILKLSVVLSLLAE